MSLYGYEGFSFGESLKAEPFNHVGSLFERGSLRVIWGQGTSHEWRADSLGFSAAFLVDARSPSVEEQEAAVARFFKNEGASIIKVNAQEKNDHGMTIREIEIKMPVTDLEKARMAIAKLDTAGLKLARERVTRSPMRMSP